MLCVFDATPADKKQCKNRLKDCRQEAILCVFNDSCRQEVVLGSW